MKLRKAVVVNRSEGLADDAQWYKDAIIYEVRVRSFFDSNGDGIGDLQGLTQKLDYLADLGVTCLWLLPLCPSPLRDDGYDIAEYKDVHAEVGTLDDFRAFLHEAHRRGIRVITELVLNHTSDQHPWFQRARRAPSGSVERDFYVWSDTPERYRHARIIFKDFEPSNWSWDPVAKAYFWHRFYSHQPDLNFENPAVHDAMLDVVDFWFGLGVDGLRLDAVPYLYEGEGTNCENLEPTHAFLKKLRAHVDEKFRNRMLLAEANQWPEDAAAYFGDGDECHMNFHFPLMPRMFMAIHQEDRFPLIDILAQTPQLHPACQWALFLRNHDELTLEMVTDEERDYMYKAFAHDQTMRINLGIRRRLAPLVQNNRRMMELLNGLLFSLPGTPVLYYGDEIGMGDNVYLGDRNGVRTPMQWSADRNAGFSRANPQKLILPIIIDPEYHYESIHVEGQQNNPNSLLWWTKRLIALRKRHKSFGRGTIEFLNPENSRVLAFVRRFDDETILVVANLSRFAQFVELDLSPYRGFAPVELFGHATFPTVGDGPYMLTLSGHAFYWFSLEKPTYAEDEARELSYQPPFLELNGAWDAVFQAPTASMLEEALPAFIDSRSWFASRGRSITQTKIVDVFPMQDGERGGARIALVQVSYTEGEPETLALPLAFAIEDRSSLMRIRAPQATLAQLRALNANGEPVTGPLFEAFVDPEPAHALLALVLDKARLRGRTGELVGSTTALFEATARDAAFRSEPRLLGPEHTNAIVMYDDTFVLKYFRTLEDGTSPDLEVGRFLNERAPKMLTPPLVGALEYRVGKNEPVTVAVVQAHVANEGTTWRYTRGELDRFYERVLTQHRDERPVEVGARSLIELSREAVPPAIAEVIGTRYLEVAELLGTRTGEMHLALASAPDLPAFSPEAYTALDHRSKYQSMRNLVGKVLRQLRTRHARLPERALPIAEEVLAREADVYKRLEPLLKLPLSALRTRLHGDFHLGQVLYAGRDLVILDFEGDRSVALSERRRKRSPLRDVANMVNSFHDAAYTGLLDESTVRDADRAALADWTHAWTAWVSAAYLRGYFAATQGASFRASDEETAALLDVFVFATAFQELGSELSSRSSRVLVPLLSVAQQLGVTAPIV
jgi:maltose alpha-D-glucosyltransferase/alpha-amylase